MPTDTALKLPSEDKNESVQRKRPFNPLALFRTGPDRPLLADEAVIDRLYRRKRWSVFLSLVVGYSFFYVCRLSLSVAKKPLIDSGVLNADQLGSIGAVMLLAYAIGKFVNGFLADRSNVGRFISTGLLASSLVSLLFGFMNGFWAFFALWAANGWFQSMGSAPCGAALSQWFSNRERGTRYGLWSTAHSLGEGFTFLVTAAVVSYFGWRWGMWGAGIICALVALALYKTLADRPQTYGLPPVSVYKNDLSGESRQDACATMRESVSKAQWSVLRNPYVWILGLSSAMMYVARYGIDNWGVIYLQESKAYTLIAAGSILSCAKIMETAGALTSGIVSDYFFRSRRNVTTLLYGLIEIAGLIILLGAPSTHLFSLDRSLIANIQTGRLDDTLSTAFAAHKLPVEKDATIVSAPDGKTNAWVIGKNAWYMPWSGYRIVDTGDRLNVTSRYGILHLIGTCCFGFGLGGLLVFLGGLIAIDICSKKASGAAMGLVGMLSYFGASVGEKISGHMIEAGKTVLNGQHVHDFSRAFTFWLTAAILAVALSCTLWRVKAKE